MSGSPSEAEIQAQWQNAVAILEDLREYADGTLAGQLDTLTQSLEGEYTPAGLTSASAALRAGVSSLISPAVARVFLDPVIFEYARLLNFGSGFRTVEEIMPRLREYFDTNSYSVRARNPTFGTPAAGGSNVGNGSLSRLYVDRYGEEIESVTIETKRLRCIADQNSGAQEHAERFEVLGAAEGIDNLLRGSFGSGENSRQTIVSMHSGTGSILTNSSFGSYAASSTPKFRGWTETAGGAQLSQDTTNFYRTAPGEPTGAALQIDGTSGTVTITQPLTAMRQRSLDPNTPYFLRAMLNKTVGTAAGGTVVLRLGSQSASVTIAALGSNWQELIIPIGTASWLDNFNADPLTIEIEWTSPTSGTLLVDDVIFAPMVEVDTTYLALRGGATPWLLDDEWSIADSDAAPGTGKIQYWLWVAGLGYLPSLTSSETFSDPA